jgi:hypothetical protein
MGKAGTTLPRARGICLVLTHLRRYSAFPQTGVFGWLRGVDLNPSPALIPRKLLILRYAKTAQSAKKANLFYTFFTLAFGASCQVSHYRLCRRLLAFPRNCGRASFGSFSALETIRSYQDSLRRFNFHGSSLHVVTRFLCFSHQLLDVIRTGVAQT